MSTHRPDPSTWNDAQHKPATQVAFAVLVAVLILFLWLHFILAQQTEVIGRQIAAAGEELQQIERYNQELLQEITVAESQANMSLAAQILGFQPQQPLYLGISQPLVVADEHAGEGKTVLYWMINSVPEQPPGIEGSDSEPAAQTARSPSIADLP